MTRTPENSCLRFLAKRVDQPFSNNGKLKPDARLTFSSAGSGKRRGNHEKTDFRLGLAEAR